MNLQQIQTVVNLIAQSHVHEVEIKNTHGHIRVKNRSLTHTIPANSELPQYAASLTTDLVPTLNTETTETLHTVTSPFIGRVQLSADIASEPLVKVGDTIAVGDTLAYVASLGQLQPVVSDRIGVIKTVLVKQDDAVEYGTPLFCLC